MIPPQKFHLKDQVGREHDHTKTVSENALLCIDAKTASVYLSPTTTTKGYFQTGSAALKTT